MAIEGLKLDFDKINKEIKVSILNRLTKLILLYKMFNNIIDCYDEKSKYIYSFVESSVS